MCMALFPNRKMFLTQMCWSCLCNYLKKKGEKVIVNTQNKILLAKWLWFEGHDINPRFLMQKLIFNYLSLIFIRRDVLAIFRVFQFVDYYYQWSQMCVISIKYFSLLDLVVSHLSLLLNSTYLYQHVFF